MDDELLELQRQFEFAQQAKSSIRLSERNVVELIQKLQQLQIIDFELLHTVSGKEYITLDQLRNEMVSEVKRLGRVSLIDLADATGVDLYYVEKQAQSIVADHAEFMMNQGEIMSESYWDSIAEEVNERLQECSQIALTELAAQLNVGLDLVASVLEPRLGTMVKGRLEGGQLYTPAYVARVSAMVRGAARGITVPMNLTVLWSSLQQLLQEMDGASGVAVDGSFFQSLFNGLVKEGEILGSVRAGVHWTPAVFAVAQKESVDSFFSQNSFISYEVLHKLGIPQPIQFLQSRYPEGKPLVTTFVHQSMIEMLDAATEDAIERGSWSDSLCLLPSSFSPQDAAKMLSLCQSVQLAVKSNKAYIFGEFYVLSSSFMKDICDRMVKELETLGVSGSSGTMISGDLQVANEAKGYDSSRLKESNEMASDGGKGSKKKRGKAAGNAVANLSESGTDNQEQTTTKSKKNQRKGKDTSSQMSGSRKESLKMKEDNLSSPSEEWIMQKITTLVPEFEEQGLDDPETILGPLANQLRPTIISSWMENAKAWVNTVTEDLCERIDKKQWLQALEVFDMLKEQSFYEPKEGTYMKLIVLLGKSGQPHRARQLFETMIEEGCDPTPELYTALLAAYCRSNLIDEAFSILGEMKNLPLCQPDVFTYSSLIKACMDVLRFDSVELLYEEMAERNITPNTVTQNIVLSGYGRAGKFDQMEKVLSSMLESATCKPDAWTMNIIISIFGNMGQIDMMEKWYEKFRDFGIEPETRTFNILIGAYGKKRLYDKMSSVMEYMRKLQFPWTTSTYNNVIEAFADVGDAKHMEYTFDQMRAEGMKADTKTFCCLINGYANAGLFHKVISSVRLAAKFEVPENTSFYNAVLSACAKAEDLMEMERVFTRMKDNQCQPDDTTFSIMVEAYRKEGMNDKIFYLEQEKQMMMTEDETVDGAEDETID